MTYLLRSARDSPVTYFGLYLHVDGPGCIELDGGEALVMITSSQSTHGGEGGH